MDLGKAEYFGFTGDAQVIHYAVCKLAKEVLPSYEADDGELKPKQLVAIRKAIPQGRAKSVNRVCFEAWVNIVFDSGSRRNRMVSLPGK
jgi:hypothetical protein